MKQPSNSDEIFLGQAIELATLSARSQGGPFGAVIVRDGEVIGRGHNQVTETCDPSAHAEIMAIREACRTMGRYHLEDCIIYSSCEPCPMCLSAIYWARIPKLVYAASAADAANAGFDDQFIYDELSKPHAQRQLEITHLEIDEANESFRAWLGNEDKLEY